MPYSFEIWGRDLAKLRFVWFLEELPDELSHPIEAAWSEVVNLIFLLFFVTGQELFHPIEGILTARLQVKII